MCHSIWLKLDHDADTLFRTLIKRTAKELDTPEFQPHLTLLSEITSPIDTIQNICSSLIDLNGPIELTGNSINETSRSFMSLFLNVEVPNEVILLRNRICRYLNSSNKDHFVPHISLAYFAESSSEKEAQAGRLGDDLRGIKFNVASIEIVRSADTIPVDEWKVISAYSF